MTSQLVAAAARSPGVWAALDRLAPRHMSRVTRDLVTSVTCDSWAPGSWPDYTPAGMDIVWTIG